MRGGGLGQRRRGGKPGIDDEPRGDLFGLHDRDYWRAAGFTQIGQTDAPLGASVPADANHLFAVPNYFSRAGTITSVGLGMYSGANARYGLGIYKNRAIGELDPSERRWTAEIVSNSHPAARKDGGIFWETANLGVSADTVLWFTCLMNPAAATLGALQWPKICSFSPLLGLSWTGTSYARLRYGFKIPLAYVAPMPALITGGTNFIQSTEAGGAVAFYTPAILYKFSASE